MGCRRFFFANEKRVKATGTLDLLQAARLQFMIDGGPEGVSFECLTNDLSHEDCLAIALSEDAQWTSTAQKGFHIKGESSFKIKGLIDDKGKWSVKGRWMASVPSAKIPSPDLALSDLRVDLPIDLTSKIGGQSSQSQKEQQGSIYIRDLSWGTKALEGVDLYPVISKNRFQIKGPVSFNIWGGKILLKSIEGDSICSPEASFHASIGIAGLNLKELLEGSGFPISGRIDGQIPVVRYKDASLNFEGTLTLKTMGGTLRADNLSIEKPLSPGRRLGADIYWEGIQLDLLTENIPIGKINGVIKGKLTGLVIEYDQPARFLLEVESTKQKGIRQKISVDAINNLSLISTGSSGVNTVLNSGLNRFFSFYPYSKIGFRCTLENDQFSLRGLIREGGQEFLIRRSLLRGIDMINQNPENQIRFKDMKNRINRIFEKRQGAVRAE